MLRSRRRCGWVICCVQASPGICAPASLDVPKYRYNYSISRRLEESWVRISTRGKVAKALPCQTLALARVFPAKPLRAQGFFFAQPLPRHGFPLLFLAQPSRGPGNSIAKTWTRRGLNLVRFRGTAIESYSRKPGGSATRGEPRSLGCLSHVPPSAPFPGLQTEPKDGPAGN